MGAGRIVLNAIRLFIVRMIGGKSNSDGLTPDK